MTTRPQRIDFTGGDAVAIVFSGFCLTHCLCWPFLIAALPSLMNAESGMLHQVLGAFSILISFVVLGVAFDCHRDCSVIVPGIAGVTFLAVNTVLPQECCSAVNAYIAGKITFTEVTVLNWLTFMLAPIGAALLILAHFKNRRLVASRKPRGKKP